MKVYGRWGLGGVVRNEEGLIMVSATWETPCCNDPLLAEGFALLSTMRLAQDYGFRKLVFESDNEQLIHMVKEENRSNRSYLGSILQKIWSTQSLFDTCQFVFTHRSGNRLADSLVQLAHDKPNLVWFEEVLIETNSLYFHELMN